MLGQPVISILVDRVTTLDLLQAVAHQQLVEAGGEDGGRDVDKDRNPGVAVVSGEGFFAEEDGGDDAGTEVTGHVGGDGVLGEAPDLVGEESELGPWRTMGVEGKGGAYHDSVGQTDCEGYGLRAHEWVGGIKTCCGEKMVVSCQREGQKA